MTATTQAADQRPALRVKYLFVVRESEGGNREVQRLARRTLRAYRSHPEVAKMLKVGTAAFKSPPTADALVEGESRGRGVCYVVGEFAILLYVGSAAKKHRGGTPWSADDARDENAFCEFLRKAIKFCNPETIVAAEPARLSRNYDAFVDAKQLIKRNRIIVRTRNGNYDLCTRQDDNAFSMAIMNAQAERDEGQSRFLDGIVEALRNGEFPRSGSLLPLGFTKVDHKACVDPEQVAMVRRVVQILGTPGITSNEMVELFAVAGVKAPRASTRAGHTLPPGSKAPSITAVRNRSDVVRRFQDCLTVWHTGKYLFTHGVSLADIEEIGEQPVLRDADGNGWIEYEIDFGLPEGGFATDEEFAAAFARVDINPNTGGARTHRTGQSVFSHLPAWWDGNGHELVLRRRNQYTVLYSDLGRGGTHQLLKVITADLVTSIADGVVEALANGVPMAPTATPAVDIQAQVSAATARKLHRIDAQLTPLGDEIDELMRTLRSLASVDGTEDPALSEFREQLNGLLERRKRLELERRSVVAASTPRPNGDDAPRVDDVYIARALAILRSCHDTVDAPVARAIADMLQNVRMWPGDDGFAYWSCMVHLRTTHGTVILGPVEGRLPSTGATGTNAIRRERGHLSVEAEALAKGFLVEGWSVEEAAERLGITAAYTQTLLAVAIGELGVAKGMVSAVLNGCPVQTRRSLATVVGLVDGAADDWHDVLRRTYLGDNTWAMTWRRDAELRQSVIDEIAARGGVVTLDQAREISGSRSNPHRFARVLKGYPPTLRRVGTGTSTVFRLVECRSCRQHADVVLRVPELEFGYGAPTAVACSRCHLPANATGPQLPAHYFERT